MTTKLQAPARGALEAEPDFPLMRMSASLAAAAALAIATGLSGAGVLAAIGVFSMTGSLSLLALSAVLVILCDLRGDIC